MPHLNYTPSIPEPTLTVWELTDSTHYTHGFQHGEAVIHVGLDRYGYYIVIMDGSAWGDNEHYDTLGQAVREAKLIANRRADARRGF